ncbi:MAG: RNA polymerase sigma factor [Candidatus Hydrogenedentes bacterium]|nr:RNA polymerase sigma factor [Candidatus Hydrogenedentota bacterium]
MITFFNSDADAVQAVLRGQRERFEFLVRRYLKDVQAVACAYTRNPTDAEDIAQDAFLKAFEELGQLREPKRFRHWLLTITRNQAHAHWRQRERESATAAPVVMESPRAALEKEEQLELLRHHLLQLDDSHREILLLHYFAGRSTRDIASLLNISRDAVKKRLERARAELGASLLKELQGTPAGQPLPERQVASIMALVLVANVVPISGASAVISTSAGVGTLTFKAVSVLVAAVLGAGILLFFSRTPSEADPTPARTNPQLRPQPGPEKPSSVPWGTAVETGEAAATEAAKPAQEPVSSQPDAPTPITLAQFVEQTTQPPVYLAEDILDAPIMANFEDISLAEVLGFFQGSFKVPAYLDGSTVPPTPAYVTDGMVPEFQANDLTLQQALDNVCEPLGLVNVLEPGFILITTEARLKATGESVPRERLKEYDLEELLSQPAKPKLQSHRLQDAHLSMVLSFMGDVWKASLVLDHSVVAPALEREPNLPPGVPAAGVVTKVQLPDGTWIEAPGVGQAFGQPGAFPGIPEGIGAVRVSPLVPKDSTTTGAVPELVVPYILLRDMKLRDALHALLFPLDLTYDLRPEGILIGSRQRVRTFSPRLAKLETPNDLLLAAMEKPVSVSAEKARATDVLRQLQQQTGLPVLVRDDAEAGKELVAFKVENKPLEAALALLSFVTNVPLSLSKDALLVGAKIQQDLGAEYVPL